MPNPTKKQINDAFEEMFRITCYACHNHYVDPKRTPPAVPLDEPVRGSTWGHASNLSTDGYIGCYASKLRDIVAGLFLETK